MSSRDAKAAFLSEWGHLATSCVRNSLMDAAAPSIPAVAELVGRADATETQWDLLYRDLFELGIELRRRDGAH